jgi:hypothetical protein
MAYRCDVAIFTATMEPARAGNFCGCFLTLQSDCETPGFLRR